MPSALDPGDRKILLIGGTVLALLILATVTLAPPANDADGQGVPSTYSAANNGAQAAYLLLQQLGYHSERWEKSPAELPQNSEGVILILAGPTDFPDKDEQIALLSFAKSGGTIIYAGSSPFLFLQTGAVAPAISSGIKSHRRIISGSCAQSIYARRPKNHAVGILSLGQFGRQPGPALRRA